MNTFHTFFWSFYCQFLKQVIVCWKESSFTVSKIVIRKNKTKQNKKIRTYTTKILPKSLLFQRSFSRKWHEIYSLKWYFYESFYSFFCFFNHISPSHLVLILEDFQLTLNWFHKLLWRFHCWLWTSKFRFGFQHDLCYSCYFSFKYAAIHIPFLNCDLNWFMEPNRNINFCWLISMKDLSCSL